MQKYISHIIIFLCSIIFIEGCRCSRDFEDENACCRSYVVIDIKPADDEAFIDLTITDIKTKITSSQDKKKATLYIDLDETLEYKDLTVKKSSGESLNISIKYTTRKRLVSIKKGAIVEFKIASISCNSAKRCTVENNDYLNNLDKDADVQIFIM